MHEEKCRLCRYYRLSYNKLLSKCPRTFYNLLVRSVLRVLYSASQKKPFSIDEN